MWLKSLFTVLLFCCLSFLLVSMCYSSPETIQSKLIILKIQLNNCNQEILNLEQQLKDLKKNAIDSDLSAKKLIEDLMNQLETQKNTYKTLLEQLTQLNQKLINLENENTVLKIGIGVCGVVVIGVIIYAALK